MTSLRPPLFAMGLGFWVCLGASACATHRPATGQSMAGRHYASRRLTDGHEWMTENLNLTISPSYCYNDAETFCRRYGRLYTWESARRACSALGHGWRLPTDDDWRRLASLYGGVSAESSDSGRSAYAALLAGGKSGFDALLGGGRGNGDYTRMEAHGFYWTASESGPAGAVYYNFGSGGLALHRQGEGEKERAFSVRCLRD